MGLVEVHKNWFGHPRLSPKRKKRWSREGFHMLLRMILLFMFYGTTQAQMTYLSWLFDVV